MTNSGLFRRRRSRVFSTGLFVTAVVALLLSPAHLMGDADQLRSKKQDPLERIRLALQLQETGMSQESLTSLAHGIMEESEGHSLDPMLVLAVIQVEGQFDRKATSSQGAQGLMQVRPVVVTALIEEGKIPALKRNRNLDLIDPLVNVKVGASYLAQLKEMFGDLRIALTAYNSGPTWVSRKILAKEALPFEYAAKVLSAMRSIENRPAPKETGRSELAATSIKSKV